MNRPRRPKRGVEVYLYSFFNPDARWGCVVNATPRPLYPRERSGSHCIRGWDVPRGQCGLCGGSRPTPGFDPRTVEPVASHYTDYVTVVHVHWILACFKFTLSVRDGQYCPGQHATLQLPLGKMKVGWTGQNVWLADVISSVHLDGRGDGMILLKYILGKLEMNVSCSGSCPMVGIARLWKRQVLKFCYHNLGFSAT